MKDPFTPPQSMVLGTQLNQRVPAADQMRQRAEALEILARLRSQPGVVLADEVGMGKTYVALAVAYAIAIHSPQGPVIIMTPANLIDKWEQDLRSFCELYVVGFRPLQTTGTQRANLRRPNALRYGVARHSIELLRLLDDPPGERCHIIFVSQSAMSRQKTDKWIRLALIAETLRTHGRGRAARLIQVKQVIHRFLAELLWAVGEQKASDYGEQLWNQLLSADPVLWKQIYNDAMSDPSRHLTDDPVPKAVARALTRIDLKALATALEEMPVRFSGDGVRMRERMRHARGELGKVENGLWRDILSDARWRSPLLVMDEAHHLKNSDTSLAKQLQSSNLEAVAKTGQSALAGKFDRMLFLTATPFQLAHTELVRVLERFGDVNWNGAALGNRGAFAASLHQLGQLMDDSQRKSIHLKNSWDRLRPEDLNGADTRAWWRRLQAAPADALNSRHRAVVDAYAMAHAARDAAESALRPWVIRHNKGTHWAASDIARRQAFDGASIMGASGENGLAIQPDQLLPFFLAARGAANPHLELLGEALCSSYEAFRSTRTERASAKDTSDDIEASDEQLSADLTRSTWYLAEFDRVLESSSGRRHPKINATVQKVADLWERGEKVVVFGFYRHTCRALRIHINAELEQRTLALAQRRLRALGHNDSPAEVERLIGRVHDRYFDAADAPGRAAIDGALETIVAGYETSLANMTPEQRAELIGVMRRFLRVQTTLVRSFPIEYLDDLEPAEAVAQLLEAQDGSGLSWRAKFDTFVAFLAQRSEERQSYIEAAGQIQTGSIRVKALEDPVIGESDRLETLANIQVATGETERATRTRLMRAFNTPFFPDILVCSEVMGEGVDLHRFCRHIIHHDLAWNPSTIEQRTGRIDRLGCKAEGRHPIAVYRPYLAGTADERQFKVMTDRERWFRVVMGQDEVAKLIQPNSTETLPLPEMIAESLSFKLGLPIPHAPHSDGS